MEDGKPRDGAEPLPSFGRARDGSERLTDLGCPDCRGVLAVSPLGEGNLWFTCRVGHAFSLESLVRAKEEQLETALWTAAQTFDEVAHLHAHLAGRATNDETARALAARGDRATRSGVVVRDLIAADGAVRPDEDPREPCDRRRET